MLNARPERKGHFKSIAKKFDSSLYLEQNPDVKASGMNPLLHFILHGM
jgi:hypothetical protein